MALKNRFFAAALLLALTSAVLIGESECRTRLVMGRKSITRTYYKEPAIPAWATVTLIGVGILIMGGILYVVLHKVYLHEEKEYKEYVRVHVPVESNP